ncbi:MAG TPA: hypothetical protein VFQ61_37000 [Polyangiaceae bacterium]|nr:hypothetical protein [Polyangiaceae bacterium]
MAGSYKAGSSKDSLQSSAAPKRLRNHWLLGSASAVLIGTIVSACSGMDQTASTSGAHSEAVGEQTDLLSDGSPAAGASATGSNAAAGNTAAGNRVEFCYRGEQMVRPVSVYNANRSRGAYLGACDLVENRTSLGDGYVQTFIHRNSDGSLRAIGVQIDQVAMDTLPMEPVNDGATCFDQDGDGELDPHMECSGGHERVLFFPKVDGLPISWIMFNWQSMGHAPMNVFDKAHFDLHYFIQDYISRNFIRTGPCGTQVNCDDFDKAMRDIPAPFFPVGFENVGGVAGRMGNHLVNKSEAPFNGEPFTQAFAYGEYDAHLSFFEPVVGTDYLKTRPNTCGAIKPPPAVELSGLYPKKYCSRFRADRGDYIMTLEDFEYRAAP